MGSRRIDDTQEQLRIALIDVDGHNFPNLPLMKLSAWHKKNGDQVEIVEPASLPLNQKLMYQIENAEDKIIINYKGTKTIIPVENILFATSSPLTITHEEMIDEI